MLFLQWNRSPLFNAVDSGSIKAVRSLLKAEAKTDVVNEVRKSFIYLNTKFFKIFIGLGVAGG